jgi:predicted NBD/HSP70 family sugar kinase
VVKIASMHVDKGATTVDAAAMRVNNAGLVLNLIWREREISRAELARRTGLSPSTVSDIVGQLTGAGLVRTLGAGSSRSVGGRRPLILGFDDDALGIVGLELGSTHVSVVLTNLRCEVRAFRHAVVPVREQPAQALETARAFIDECLKAERLPRRRLIGLGVAVPSPVRPEHPGALSPLFLEAWKGVDVFRTFRDAYRVPVHIDNDANLGALAERFWGHGRGVDDLTYIKLGTGIGAGHVIRGQLYRGAGGSAGEIGHVAIDPGGPRCVCGLRGCLVTFIGAPALLARARAVGLRGKAFNSVSDLVRAAHADNAAARTLVDEAAGRLGIVVGGLLNLLNPAMVVLGGELSSAGELLLAPLRAALRDRALSTSVAETTLLASELGDRAIAVGAATLVLESVLRTPALLLERAG